jgi:predicted dehydrogenase
LTTREHRVGIVGAGLMGRRHAEAFAAVRGVRVAAVCDLDLGVAAEAAGDHGARAVGDVDELLADETVDIVVVAVGDRWHLAPARAALGAGRNVLVEKPLASTVADARELDDLARAASSVVAVGHQLRLDARFAGAADAVRGGGLGALIHASFRRNSSVSGPRRYGTSTTLASHVLIHDVDLLHFITGSTITSVYARGAKLTEGGSDYDSIVVAAELDGGAVASFEASWALPETVGASLDAIANVVCTRGSASVTSAEQGLSLVDEESRRYPDTVRYYAIGGRSNGLLHEQARAFVDAVDGAPSLLCSAEDGLRAVEIIDAVSRSLISGQVEAVLPHAPTQEGTR